MPLNSVTPLYSDRELAELHPKTPGNLKNIILGVKAQIWDSHPWDVVEDPFDLSKGDSRVLEYLLIST